MRHFLIIANEREKNMAFVNSVASAIETKGGYCRITDSRPGAIEVPPEAECILSIGGDGSLIRAAHSTFAARLPLLGVNRGHLGYLCDLDESNVYEAIDRLFEEEYGIEERMMLSGKLGRSGDPDETSNEGYLYHALNDIVISRTGELSVMHLSVYVGGRHLYSFDGDGVILATPTGSTAYNLSAGGPIVDPNTEVILLTPINPHNMNSRSIVLDRRDEVSIELTPRSTRGEECVVSFDGTRRMMLRSGIRLMVKRADERVKMLRLSRMNFLERMRAMLV